MDTLANIMEEFVIIELLIQPNWMGGNNPVVEIVVYFVGRLNLMGSLKGVLVSWWSFGVC